MQKKSILQNAIFFMIRTLNKMGIEEIHCHSGHIRTPIQHSNHGSPRQIFTQEKGMGKAEVQLSLCVKAMVLHRTSRFLR